MKDVGDQIDILVGYLVSKKNTRNNTTFVVTKACKRRGNMDKGFTIIEILKYLLLTDKFMKDESRTKARTSTYQIPAPLVRKTTKAKGTAKADQDREFSDSDFEEEEDTTTERVEPGVDDLGNDLDGNSDVDGDNLELNDLGESGSEWEGEGDASASESDEENDELEIDELDTSDGAFEVENPSIKKDRGKKKEGLSRSRARRNKQLQGISEDRDKYVAFPLEPVKVLDNREDIIEAIKSRFISYEAHKYTAGTVKESELKFDRLETHYLSKLETTDLHRLYLAPYTPYPYLLLSRMDTSKVVEDESKVVGYIKGAPHLRPTELEAALEQPQNNGIFGGGYFKQRAKEGSKLFKSFTSTASKPLRDILAKLPYHRPSDFDRISPVHAGLTTQGPTPRIARDESETINIVKKSVRVISQYFRLVTHLGKKSRKSRAFEVRDSSISMKERIKREDLVGLCELKPMVEATFGGAFMDPLEVCKNLSMIEIFLDSCTCGAMGTNIAAAGMKDDFNGLSLEVILQHYPQYLQPVQDLIAQLASDDSSSSVFDFPKAFIFTAPGTNALEDSLFSISLYKAFLHTYQLLSPSFKSFASLAALEEEIPTSDLLGNTSASSPSSASQSETLGSDSTFSSQSTSTSNLSTSKALRLRDVTVASNLHEEPKPYGEVYDDSAPRIVEHLNNTLSFNVSTHRFVISQFSAKLSYASLFVLTKSNLTMTRKTFDFIAGTEGVVYSIEDLLFIVLPVESAVAAYGHVPTAQPYVQSLLVFYHISAFEVGAQMKLDIAEKEKELGRALSLEELSEMAKNLLTSRRINPTLFGKALRLTSRDYTTKFASSRSITSTNGEIQEYLAKQNVVCDDETLAILQALEFPLQGDVSDWIHDSKRRDGSTSGSTVLLGNLTDPFTIAVDKSITFSQLKLYGGSVTLSGTKRILLIRNLADRGWMKPFPNHFTVDLKFSEIAGSIFSEEGSHFVEFYLENKAIGLRSSLNKEDYQRLKSGTRAYMGQTLSRSTIVEVWKDVELPVVEVKRARVLSDEVKNSIVKFALRSNISAIASIGNRVKLVEKMLSDGVTVESDLVDEEAVYSWCRTKSFATMVKSKEVKPGKLRWNGEDLLTKEAVTLIRNRTKGKENFLGDDYLRAELLVDVQQLGGINTAFKSYMLYELVANYVKTAKNKVWRDEKNHAERLARLGALGGEPIAGAEEVEKATDQASDSESDGINENDDYNDNGAQDELEDDNEEEDAEEEIKSKIRNKAGPSNQIISTTATSTRANLSNLQPKAKDYEWTTKRARSISPELFAPDHQPFKKKLNQGDNVEATNGMEVDSSDDDKDYFDDDTDLEYAD